MKKKSILVTIALIILIIAFFIINHYKLDEKPFENLGVGEVKEITLNVTPSGKSMVITETNTIKKFTDILNNIEIYEKDDSWKKYFGGFNEITVSMVNGENIKIVEFNPFLIINDVGYKTNYDVCEKLDELINNIID